VIPEILKNRATEWYLDTSDDTLLAYDNNSNVKIAMHLRPNETVSVYIASAGKVKPVSMILEQFKKIR
jgi:hypothetical protein